MKITHYGHSALLLEYDSENAGRLDLLSAKLHPESIARGTNSDSTKLLIDPGNLSIPQVSEITGLSAILLTHQHPDHCYVEHLEKLLPANEQAVVYAETQTWKLLHETKALKSYENRILSFKPGQNQPLGSDNSITLSAMGGAHATIHPDIPAVGNLCFILNADAHPSFAHTGDSLVPHPEIIKVECLAFPVVAPWSKIQETIDFLRIVKAGVALPVHEGVASEAGLKIYLKQSQENAPADTRVHEWL